MNNDGTTHGGASESYGIESPGTHPHHAHRAPARYLVLIASGNDPVARLFLADHTPAGELDAATEEATQMMQGLTPERSALEPEWDDALAGHTAAERGLAEVYTLDV